MYAYTQCNREGRGRQKWKRKRRECENEDLPQVRLTREPPIQSSQSFFVIFHLWPTRLKFGALNFLRAGRVSIQIFLGLPAAPRPHNRKTTHHHPPTFNLTSHLSLLSHSLFISWDQVKVLFVELVSSSPSVCVHHVSSVSFIIPAQSDHRRLGRYNSSIHLHWQMADRECARFAPPCKLFSSISPSPVLTFVIRTCGWSWTWLRIDSVCCW